jgi:hypothetical protein
MARRMHHIALPTNPRPNLPSSGTTSKPCVLSVTPNNGDAAGATSVTIKGKHFTGTVGASGVQFDGVNAAAYAVVDDNTITAVTPAGSAGFVTVAVTTPSGTGSRARSFIYTGGAFDPATLPLTLWLRDYAGAPWVSTASAGTSGDGKAFVSTGSDPSIGSLNGHGLATFDGAANFMTLSGFTDWDDLIDNNAATVVALAKSNIAPAHGTWFSDPTVITTPDQIFGLAFSDAGAELGTYDSSTFGELDVAMASGGYHAMQFTHDGVDIRGRVDGGGFSTQTKGLTASLALETSAMLAKSSAASVFWNGDIVELMIADSVLSDADLDNIKSYFNARYGLAL